jgi:hypothetical protein
MASLSGTQQGELAAYVPNCSSGGLSVDAVNLLKEHCRYD